MAFYNPVKIVMGLDGLTELVTRSAEPGAGVYVMTDGWLSKSGAVRAVTEPLEAAGFRVLLNDSALPDPQIGQLLEPIEAFVAHRPAVLIAMGGGSVIDAAKAVLYFARAAENSGETVFIAIPTTSGTGSEVTSFSVITDEKRMLKRCLINDSLLPAYAVLDETLPMSMPASVTADTGLDVLTHALEAFVSPQANDFTDACAEKALKLVAAHLIDACRTPSDTRARQAMHHASCLAGIAFNNASLGLNHAMAHAIGAWAKLPHGRTNAVLLPYVVAFNMGDPASPEPAAARYAAAAEVLGLESGGSRRGSRNLIRYLCRLRDELSVPATFEAAGVLEADFLLRLDDLTETALQDRCAPGNPVPLTAAAVRAVFLNAYYGRMR